MSVQVGRLLQRAYDPALTAPGRRCEVLLGILRDWADPLTSSEIRTLTGWSPTQVREALCLLDAEGRIGAVGRGCHGAALWIADPPLDLPCPNRITDSEGA